MTHENVISRDAISKGLNMVATGSVPLVEWMFNCHRKI